MTQASTTDAKSSWWDLLRSLRTTIERIQAFDFQEVENRTQALEAVLHNIDQRLTAIEKSLQEPPPTIPTPTATATLITPLDLKIGDRFLLEDRCRQLTNPAYLGDDTALCRVLGFHKIYVDTNDTGFSSNILLDGYWEMWLTIFFAREIEPGMTVIDVGANFGYYTLLFGRLVAPQGHVYAIEPNPAVLPKLQRSVRLNGLSEHTTIIAGAAGAEPDGEVELFVPHGEPKNSSVTVTREMVSAGIGEFHRVRRVQLDTVIGDRRVDFVKIDAEGAEEEIMRGMEMILQRDQPRLLLEFNIHRYSDPQAFIRWLESLYGRLRYVDFHSNAIDVSPEQLLTEQRGEDWLLLLDKPG